MTEAEKILKWCNFNADAARLVSDLFELSQIADDLVDNDKPGDNSGRMVRLLHLALISIPANPFHANFKGWLSPMISAALLAWDQANVLEMGGKKTEKAFAFAYRDLLELLLVQVAHLTGGLTHAREAQDEIFRFFRFQHPDGQTFKSYYKEHAQ